jgi:hypothetical protein
VVDDARAVMHESFLTYFRRVLGEAGGGDAVVVDERGLALSAATTVGLVDRPPSSWTRRRIHRQTGLEGRFAGSWSTGASGPAQPFELFDRWDPRTVGPTPTSFDVLAVVMAYNEAGVIGGLIGRLLAQGVRVHVIDNWSDDDTMAVVSAYVGDGSVTVEQFPADGPRRYYELKPLLERIEAVAQRSGADWVIHHDADEIRQSPWPDIGLADALWAVEQWGFNCIDHTIVNFRPTDDRWQPGHDLATSFDWCEFGARTGHFVQCKAFKPQPGGVSLAESGGHNVRFDGRRVFPYKFITRHYPIRSQAHGERKVLRERQPRWSPEARARGWHTQYDQYHDGSSFLWDEADLFAWHDVDRYFLLQRLTGIGLAGNPHRGEGPPPAG